MIKPATTAFEKGDSLVEERNELLTHRIEVRRAFISAHDKTGLIEFAGFLAEKGIEIYATEGTASCLREASIPVRPVNELTGFAELLSGKVKSLSPGLHAGILFSRSSSEERLQIEEQGLVPIDMVVVNFYPFHEVADTTPIEEATKKIDIGGPAALRAAAKNFRWVVPVPEPAWYGLVKEDMLKDESSARKGECSVSLHLSLELAAVTFAITADYESKVESYLSGQLGLAVRRAVRSVECVRRRPESVPGVSSPFPARMDLHLRKLQELRYGENPHQPASFYTGSPGRSAGEGHPAVKGHPYSPSGESRGLRTASGSVEARVAPGMGEGSWAEEGCWGRQLQGKELSFNNLLDLDAAVSACREFEAPSCVIIKHRSPCGAAHSGSLLDAYAHARDCDSLSAFGGVVAVNRSLTEAVAAEMSKLFLEIVAAPSFEPETLRVFAKKKNLRLMELFSDVLARDRSPRVLVRSGPGGLLFQEEDSHKENPSDWKLVSKRAAGAEEREGLLFLWRVARHAVSNAIVIGKGDRTFGIGAGQTSRVDAVEVALMKAKRAGHDVKGAWLASDGFFPFRDSLDLAAGAGVSAIVQPGGSVRDEECIRAADEHGVAMYFTGRRCFKH